MSMYGKNHYNIVISLQLIKIKGKKIKSPGSVKKKSSDARALTLVCLFRWYEVGTAAAAAAAASLQSCLTL